MIKDIAAISHQGMRDEMEDNFCLRRNFSRHKNWFFGGVFDGHRGKKTAEYAAKNLPNSFLKNLKLGQIEKEAFKNSFEEVSKKKEFEFVGCCALCFFIKSDQLYVANAGDCRLAMIFKNRVDQITRDHRISAQDEKERIIKAGGKIEFGYVWRDRDGLMPTRSLGDNYFKKVGIIAEPEVFERTIPNIPNIFLVAATDGLWDEIENEGLIELLKGAESAEEGTQRILNFLLNLRGLVSLDNISIIVAKT